MSPRRHSASSSMAAAAMPLEELERWLQAAPTSILSPPASPCWTATSPRSWPGRCRSSPLDWICPLLAIDADAFNHGGTPEFAAISAVALRHNDISNILSTAPDRFEPMHRRKPNGDVDPRPWCRGFYAAMRLRMSAWAPLLDASNVNHGLLLPILLHCRDDQGRPLLGPPRKRPRDRGTFCATPTPIFQRSSRPCANTGCRPATLAPADHRRRGSSYRLPCKCGPTAHFVDATDAPLTREDAVVRAAFVKAGAEPGRTNFQRHFIF